MTDQPTARHPASAMIREARLRAGLTQAELAEATGLTPSHVSVIESDRTDRSAYPAVLDRLIPALGLDRDTAYAAAGRIPAEITEAMTGNVSALRKVRKVLDL